MTVPSQSVVGLSRSQKQELLRKLAQERAGRARTAPASFAQERLWFLDRLEPESPFYNIPTALRLRGALDVAALERALGEVVRRHEALRTTFQEQDGTPVQVIAPFRGFALAVEDLSAPPGEAREARAGLRAAEEGARPFDLSAGPLFRATLLRLGDDEHLLLTCIHHIVADEWSLGVLWREMWALYGAYREGGESPLPDLPAQYADYVAWQRQALRGDALDRQLAWWRARLAGAPALLELPADRPRPAVQTHRGAVERIDLPGDLLDRLHGLSRREGATLFMVVLAAFQVLLGRYSGSDDVVVGSPITGRARREVEGLIGFFLNTLALRTELGGDPTFREVVQRVREGTLGAYQHQDIPFERLVEELRPERSLGHSPLFQVMFVLHEADGARGGAPPPGLEVSGLGTATSTSKFDLTLSLAAYPGRLSGTLEYSTDLYDRATVQRMLSHFERLLRQGVDAPDTRLSRLRLAGDDERRRVLSEWNRTEAPYPAATLHALFEAQADRTPDAVCVTHGDVSLTYRALDERANRLARHLAALGVGVDGRVGLCLERGPEMMVAVLGILKAGAAYVPLDPAYPADRLAYMLNDSAAGVLVTQRGLAEKLPAGDAVVMRVDADGDATSSRSAERPELAVAPDNLAYVIYTSGSTGRPKGVAMPHGALANLLAWQARDWRSPAPAVTLQFASISFDASFHEIFSCWTAGGRLVLIGEEQRYDPAGLLEIAEREGVERLFMPAVALHQLAEAGDERGLAPSRLREVMTAGEQLRVTGAMRRWMGRLGAPLYNHYGPSETHVVTRLALEGDPASWPLLPSIGGPIANTQAYVLDAALQPSPVGVPGELYLGGAGVARGYLNRPALTAERFAPDPFAAAPGARVYRTGDRARWLADGTIEFLGRVDEQVKIRGFRIEPGEVEAVIATHPRVRKAVVIAREDVPGDRRLVAYVVADGAVDVPELRARLKGRLPEYMVPAAFVTLDALPLTPSGKVARRALPAPEYAAAGDRYVAPRTPVEEVLAEIWAAVLRVERVGVEESFFELGGHSLLAIRVVSRVREAFAVELPLRALFEAPTIGELSARVEALRSAGAPLLPPVVPVARTGPLPLSFAQERLWFLDRLQPGGLSYHLPITLGLDGVVDAGALERALGEIVRRHEALRTTFREVEGVPVQVIAPFRGFVLPVDEVADADEAARRARAEESRPFDLSEGPLLRTKLFRAGPTEHVLVLAMHHIVSDGWSLDVLFRELAALYAAYREGRGSPLPELAVQYADHAVWQRRHLRGAALERQLAWWRERLAGAPELLELPTDHARPAVQEYRGAHEPIRIGPELLARLEALGRREGATLFMVLAGALQVLLSKYSGSEDLVIGTTSAGRTRGELEGLIGLFMNTLVLRTDLSGNPGFGEVLRRVREMTLGAYEHQDVPFERIVEELRPERSLGHSPLIQVLFELHNTDGAGGGAGLPGVGTRGMGTVVVAAKFDLGVAMTVTPRGLTGGVTYNTDLFERGTVRALVEHLSRVLEQVSADPDGRISRLRLMSRTERDRVVGWNRTTARYPADRCIHQWFEAQAARTPHAPAVTWGAEPMTYAELDARANRIARHLQGLGVGVETRVGLCLERGLEMMPALLGVMKAGGAYVPLDPAHPAERMSYVLEDSGMRVLLTEDRLLDRLPAAAGVRVVSLDAERARIEAESADAPETGVTSENLCYVIYTSGSTGRPKGVAMHHRGVSNYLHWGIRAYGADGGAGAPVFSSMAVDLTITNLLPLFAGKPVRMLPEESPVEALADLLREKPGFGLIKITPTHLSLLTPLITPEEARGAARTLVIGADFLNAEPTVFWQEHAPNVRLMNEYGPTETVVGCSAYVLPPGRHREGPVPVGHPIQNLTFYVLDGMMEPVPVGLPGELYIGGAGVARGYLDRPALSAEKFVPDPFAEPGARMYRTGDRARWRVDGNLVILGRTDNQVKIRGYRVELGEVEAAVRAHPDVRACLAVMREDVPGDRRLVAYVVGDAAAAGPAALRGHMLGSVPEYMVPSAFVRLDALPQTPTGKLNPRMLPPPVYATTAAVAPRSGLERQVAEVWTGVLSLAEVGVHDNFFDLGGTSLLLYRVYSRLREIRPDLRLVDLFRFTTVETLAAHLAADAPRGGDFLAQSRSRAAERRAARLPVRGG